MKRSSSNKSKVLARLWNWGRLMLGLLGLAYVIYAVAEDDDLFNTFLQVDLLLIFIAFVLTVGATIIKTARWYIVLQHSQITIGFQRLFGTYLVGTFFSQFMPGSSMGGDAMRMVETSVDTGRAVTSVSSVLVERAIGLLTILCSASIILLLFPSEELTGSIIWWMMHFLSITGLVGMTVLRMGWFVTPTVSILERIKLRVIGDKIVTLSQALRAYLGETRLIVSMVGFSFLANAATMTAAYIALLSLGTTTPYLSFIPLIALTVAVEIIPISPGALGLREASYVAFLTGFLAVAQAEALATALLVRGIGMALGIIGGIVFVARIMDSTQPNLTTRVMDSSSPEPQPEQTSTWT